MDPATGAITGITITSAGSGYNEDAKPTITCPGGGSAGVLSMTLDMDVTFDPPIDGVAANDRYIINNAHKVKLAKTTDLNSIAASADAEFYTFDHGMHIMFRGDSRCPGRAARILHYDTGNKCATIGSDLEVGDYNVLKGSPAAADVSVHGNCKGAQCDLPWSGSGNTYPGGADDPSGLRGASSGHISSVKILGGTTASCTTKMFITASDGGGSGFKARIASVDNGKITGIQILNAGTGYTSVPKLLVSSANCQCDGNAWNSNADNGLACVQAMRGLWSDGGNACVAGGGGAHYVIVKDPNVAAAISTGVLRGTNYIEGGAYAEGHTAGDSEVRITGAYLFPNDMHVSKAASVTNVQLMTGKDVSLNLQYLQVLIGGKEATGCTLHTFPRGVDPAQATRDDDAVTDLSGMSELPEIRCKAPAGVGSGDLTVTWHGIPVTISNWWKYDVPTVNSVKPAAVPYSGGTFVTIKGSNFGPRSSWSKGAAKGGRIEVMGWGVTTCSLVSYVSDSSLVCRMPALSARTHPVDKASAKVRVQMVVSVGAQRSKQGSSSQLEYTSVPMYYSCDTTPRDTCFKCCRSSCVVESFAAGKTDGFYESCDAQCYKFCGFGATN